MKRRILVAAFSLFTGSTLLAAEEVPRPPQDAIALKAYGVLEKYCSRCHQAGKLSPGLLKPKKDFGFVLDLDALAHTSKYVVPGNPDGSHLFSLVANGEMPYDGDCYIDRSSAKCPSDSDILTLREWVSALKAAEAPVIAIIRDEEAVKIITSDLGRLPPARARTTRYLSLTAARNAGRAEEDLELYRQGVTKLLNGVTRSSKVIRPEPIDASKSILRVNIADLGWTLEDWDLITTAYPYGVLPNVPESALLASLTGTNVPMVRADWLAFTASRAPLYNELLKLPETFGELQKSLGVDIVRDTENATAQRAAFVNSGVSQHNRLIERHAGSGTPMFWTSYDFSTSAGDQNLLDNPLGPGGAFGFNHKGGETIWSLPNGFQAYYLAKASGESLPTAPTDIVQDTSRVDHVVANGISCMSCHANGINMNLTDKVDQVGPYVLGADRASPNLAFPLDVRDKVAALYVPSEEMNAVMRADLERFASAMNSAGLATKNESGGFQVISARGGVEITEALATRYEDPVDLPLVAAEFGLTIGELRDRAGQLGGEAATLVRRLDQQKIVPRDEVERLFPILLPKLTTSKLVTTPSLPVKLNDTKTGFDLALTSDKTSYAIGDKLIATVRSEKECFLTLVDLDQKGVGTVLFPNKFQQDNKIPGGKDVKVPSDDAPFEITVGEENRGIETIIAVCDKDQPNAYAVQPDFHANDFTEIQDFASKSLIITPRVASVAGSTPLGKRTQTAIQITVY
ncbi:DUF4384 domain-containing protein [Mesorhizobium sp. M0816]|uniref:DUF4384 domain-containing protein n=1 Tax=Mesorhizobium sp. M0816 TaxID=2957006 RepID=UPI0033361630